MEDIKHLRYDDIEPGHESGHGDFEYYRRDIVSRGEARGLIASIYDIPPGKSAYPYHYHTMVEEVFYIISGSGILRTSEGEREVKAGDALFFPAGEKSAHRLTNNSPTETLRYIDFDTALPLDAAVYPDSGKIGVWGRGVNRVYRYDENVDYYDGE